METDGKLGPRREKARLSCKHSKLHYLKKKNLRKEKKDLLLLKYIRELKLCVNKVKWVWKSFRKLWSALMDNYW